jgi:hypothetical protein
MQRQYTPAQSKNPAAPAQAGAYHARHPELVSGSIMPKKPRSSRIGTNLWVSCEMAVAFMSFLEFVGSAIGFIKGNKEIRK